MTQIDSTPRKKQVCVLGGAEPGCAGTISEVCLAWLHHRPLLPLTGCGGWSDRLEKHLPDERGNSKILSWGSVEELRGRLEELELLPKR
jgi:hypothetical protein